MTKIINNTIKDANFSIEAKKLYLINHDFIEFDNIYVKNDIALSIELIQDMSFEDLQKYVYLANNQFHIEEGYYKSFMVKISIDDVLRQPLYAMHQSIKEAREIFKNERITLN